MNTKHSLLTAAKEAIKSQILSINKLLDFVGDEFYEVVETIYKSDGRLIITGIGKSAIIAQKIVATLNSTGTPSAFMHASEAIHGDLGMVQQNDVVLCISKSGNSPEIKILIPLIKRSGNIVIGMTGNLKSFLANESNFIINTTVDSESCPNNLAPTNSTTAQLVMGDAIAICLMKLRGFTKEDFAQYHPGGVLGKKLSLQVKHVLNSSLKPIVSAESSVKEVIVEISEKRLGATAVLSDGKVVGVVTDGDIRRMLNNFDNFSQLTAKDIMTKSPKMINSNDMIAQALHLFEEHSITQLIVIDEIGYQGIVHLHDILKEGID